MIMIIMIINDVKCSDNQAIAEHVNVLFTLVRKLISRNITEHGDSSYYKYL